MRIRHLIAVLLVLGLGTTGAMAASWTVTPFTDFNSTGTTDYRIKYNSEALVYGGATTGTTRQAAGFFKFDVAAINDAVTVTAVEFHFYVNATVWPYWSVTPVALDPVPLASTAALLWDDVMAEADFGDGYYALMNEDNTYVAGWKTISLGGTSNTDLTAALAQDWFCLGAASRDNDPQYFLEIDGHADTNVPYLVVHDDPAPANDDCANAVTVPGTSGSYSYTGDTTFANDDYNCYSGCAGGLSHAGGDTVYTITLPASCTVCVTLNQSVMTWNGGVYMVTDCADANGTCVAGASGWLAGGGDEVFCYQDTTSTNTYYIIVDGRDSSAGGAYQLDVVVNCLAAPGPLLCNEDGGGGVDLAWVNNDTYDSIEVYENGILLTTLPGAANVYNVAAPPKGLDCYYVCGILGTVSSCSDDCCLIMGYDNVEVLWDFNADDGGFIVDGTGGWEWGTPTYGPCFDTADGNVWGTDLDADYPVDACWLLDSGLIELGDKGGFVCFDHCYDTETGYDGGTVWFTTDDFWYYNFEPIEGYDRFLAGGPCPWVYNDAIRSFSGDSGGWVTDCWDFTGDMWLDENVKIRFAFGSDSSIVGSGWLVDNVTVYNNVLDDPISCDYTVTPLVGTLPFQTVHRMSLNNLLSGGQVWFRRIAGRISLQIGNGNYFNPWRAGFTNVQAGQTYYSQWSQNLPALGTVIGNNTFTLTAADVTPSPYNQPPYPASGTLCVKPNVVVANAP